MNDRRGRVAGISKNDNQVKTCVKTDPGLKRQENEDYSIVIDDGAEHYDTRSLGRLFAVADGIGGHQGGAKASHMACEGLLDYYGAKSDPLGDRQFIERRLEVLEKVIRRTHSNISAHAEKDKTLKRMGTTLSALVLLEDTALIAHVGDSRIYRLRNRCLEKLTEDQTMAQLSVEMGYIEQEEAENHLLRHVLLEAVGQGIDEIQTRIEKVEEGDIFLLCTDGLHHFVSNDKIKEILETFPPEGGPCGRLVQEAVKGGGKDNITVIAIRI